MADTAAARVFAVPELLENILLELALDDAIVEEWNGIKGGIIYAPTKQIFPIQRVCQTFRGAINKSPRIRQLMFLSPIEIPEELMDDLAAGDYSLPDHMPLLWLLDCMGGHEAYGELREEKINPWTTATLNDIWVDDDGKCNFPLDERFRCFRRRWNSPDASWRKIKMAHAKASQALTIRWGYSMELGLESLETETGEFNWSFKADATLGEFFDHYLKVLVRANTFATKRKRANERLRTMEREMRELFECMKEL